MSDTTVRPAAGPPRPYRFPDHEFTRLGNGMTVLVAPVRRLPICALVLVVDAGAELDDEGSEGCALLTARALAEGTRDYPGIAFTERLERIGASLEAAADWDSAHLSLSVMAERLPAALELLGAVVTDPAFPEGEVARLQEERLSEILQIRSEPRGLADEIFTRVLYSPDSRYSMPLGGTQRSVSRLDRDAVSRHHRAYFTPGRTTVIVAGDVGADAVLAQIERTFAGWSAGDAQAVPRRGIEATDRARVNLVHREDAPQSELRVGHAGVPRTHDDYFPLVLMNAVLGGLFGSRINLNLREEHAYTYGAHSGFDWRRGDGPFAIRTAVESGVTASAVSEILREVEKMRAEPVSDAEMSLAQDYLSGVFPVRFETSMAIAAALAQMVTYALPADYYDTYRDNIGRVSVADVHRVARDHLDESRITVVAVGDAAQVYDQLVTLDVGTVATVAAGEEPDVAAVSAVPTPG
jgi:zinc protease